MWNICIEKGDFMACLIEGVGNKNKWLIYQNGLDEYAKRNGVKLKSERTPIHLDDLSAMIGEQPAKLMLLMLGLNPRMSKAGFLGVVKIMDELRGGAELIPARINYRDGDFGFTLKSSHKCDLFDDDLVGTNIKYYLKFTPEHKIHKSLIRDGRKGRYELDLNIELWARKGEDESVLIDTVVVEYDGDRHLLAPKVIDDKKRDSFVQSTGVTVFRIQEPVYSTDDRVSGRDRQERLDDKINEHCKDIINFFRTKLLRSGSLLADKAKIEASELRGCD